MGAWIETVNDGFTLFRIIMSHPVWVRGLKLTFYHWSFTSNQSHPVWVRGLKLYSGHTLIGKIGVAPCMGAWIETQTVR